ncbi:MAG TPA: hypothetical protein VNA16_03135 [Abditibacteriaceae bacterium]|nr:hypothetical protein [Abditibacteriaceae bacterium]
MLTLLQIVALVFFAFLVLAIFAVKKFGLLGLLFVAVFFVFCLSLLQRVIGKVLKRLFLSPFLAKGAVLHDAEVRVRSITPAAAPPREVYGDATDLEPGAAIEAGPRDWYALDVTITPQESNGDFTLWKPGELVLVSPTAKANDPDDEGSTLGAVHAVEVWHEGRWQPDDPGKYEGPQRLKLLAWVQPGAHRLRFRYYFEIFGDLEIPVERRGA